MTAPNKNSKHKKTKINLKKIKKFFLQIFGYSLVGITAIFYGLAKQNIDIHNSLWKLLIERDPELINIFFMVITQICFTLCFGYQYAKVYFLKTDDDCNPKIYKSARVLISCIMIINTIAYILMSIIKNNTSNIILSITVSMIYGTPLIYGFIFYRYLAKESKPDAIKKRIESRYSLVIPAILVIALNIFAGTSVYSFYKSLTNIKESTYYLIPIILVLFFMTILHFRKKTMIKTFYILFSAILFICGCLGLIFSSYNNYIFLSNIFLNFFLSIMTSIFLSIFESWYIYYRFDNSTSPFNKDDLIIKSKASLVKTVNWIVSLLPVVVFLLFPFQTFNYIYIFSFCIGMTFINTIWFTNILPHYDNTQTSNNKLSKKGISRLRACLGFTTFIFLFLDQSLLEALNIQEAANCFFNSLFDSFENQVGTIIDIILTTILFTCLVAALTHYVKLKDIFGNTFRLPIIIRLSSYIIACLIILIFYSMKANTNFLNAGKLNVSTILLSLFIICDLVFALYKYICFFQSKTDS